MTNGTRDKKPTAADYALAAQVAGWMKSLNDTPQTNDYMINLATYGRVGLTNSKGMGIVASAITAYNRELAYKVEQAKRPDYSKSVYVGQVGDRMTFENVTLLSVKDSENSFGPMYIHNFITPEGNCLTWFGSTRLYRGQQGDLETRINPGDVCCIKATVKAHDDKFKGVKATILSRADVTLPEAEVKAQKAAAAKAKRETAKAQKAARKAFGEPKTIATWSAFYSDYSSGSYERKLSPRHSARLVQFSDIEFQVETRSVNDSPNEPESAGEWHNAAETYDTAEKAMSAASYVLQYKQKN